MGYSILNRTQIFKESLMAWNNKASADKTWQGFQTHFRKAYRDLKRVKALNIKNSTIAHTTMMEELKNHQQETIYEMTNALKNSLYQTVNMMTNEEETDHSANAVTMQSLQKEIAELKKIITTLQTPQ